MQQNVTSNDISLFSCLATFDIFNRSLLFDLSATEFLNSPAGSGCSAAFEVQDQNGVKLAEIDWDNPQIPDIATDGETYELDLSYINYEFLFNAYKITAAIQDTDGNKFYLYFPVKKLCQPKGFTDNGYVDGVFTVKVDCTNSVLTVKEATNLTYNNLSPDSKVTDGTLYYPLGTIDPITFAGTPFSNNVVYTGTYKVDNTTTATYDFGDGFFVKVEYVTNEEFYFTCEKRMVDVMCCWTDAKSKYDKNCDNAVGQRTLQQLREAEIPMITGLIKEASGADASEEADAVKKILNCNCGRGAIKHVQPDPVNPTIYNIIITGAGGTDVVPSTVGNTKNYVVSSDFYVVGKKNSSDLAISITTDTSTSNTIKYLIAIDYDVLANYILTAIGNSHSLLVQFNSLVTATANIDLSNLNGKCVMDLSSLNYFLTYRVPTIATTVTNIIINTVTYTPSSTLLVSDTAGIEAFLNGLGLGTFQASFASNNGGYYINVITNNNGNAPASMTFTSNAAVTVAFAKTNASLIAFLQALVDYLCAITSLQVYLGKILTLYSLDYNDDIIQTTYGDTTTVGDYLTDLTAVVNDLVTKINDVTAITCAKMKDLFQDNVTGVFGSGDRFYGTLAGDCFAITREQAALAIIEAIQGNSTVKAAFCAISCDTPATCPDVGNISLAMSGADIGVYGLTWTPQNPIATQTVTVRYRVNGTLSWTIATNALQILANGNLAGTTPYSITGVDAGTTYDVWVTNNCGGSGFIKQITTPTGTVYSADYLLDTIIYNICGDSGVTLYSTTPFAVGVTLYTDVGLTTPVTGFDFVAPVSSGNIHEIDNSTGVVGVDTGSACSGGTLGVYILGNDTGTICSNGTTNLYTDGAFGIGGTLYLDSALTTPVTGYDFVVNTGDNHIYNLDNVTGVIGSDTGLSCSTNTVRISSTMAGVTLTAVTGIPGFTPSPPLPLSPGDVTQGIHTGFTGVINLTITGTPIISPSNMRLYRNGVLLQCLTVTGSSGVYYTFSSQTYAASDVINIALNTGSC